MTADDHDKPDSPRQANSAPVDPTGKTFRPLVVVLSDEAGEIDPAWLAQMQSTLPGHYLAASSTATAGLERLDCDPRQWPELVATAAGIDTATTHGVLIIESGLVVPGDLSDRLAVLVRSPECPPLTLFAGNHDEAANPFHGLAADLSCDWCDGLAHLAGHRQWTAVDHCCRRLSFISPNPPEHIGQLAEQGRGWVYDSIFIHDPRRELTAGHGRHPALAAALGPLRLAGARLNERGETGLALPAIGRDGKAVTLHIAHHWGGGVARWIDDILAGDDHGHHLVLAARGHTDGKVHGQRLRLYATGATRGLIGEWVLTPAIAATASAHDHYRQIVQQIIERHGIGRIIVSSLIGHSLDALQTGLPTLQVLHDYYPAWPALEHDPLAFDTGDGIDLADALAAAGTGLLFERTDVAFWQDLAQQWLRLVAEREVRLIAPTDQVRRRWCRLMGEELERIDIVPHGFQGWPDVPSIQSAARPDGRLNLVVVGRLTPGKGLGLLEQALPQLREIAHITLVGCGHHGMRLFGQAGVDILLDFKREELPGILATIRPQAALFLSTVAETWNYVLSETRSLGLVPIATRTGSFIERIDHGRDGLLFDPSARALTECLVGLHRDPAQLATLAARLPAEPGIAESIGRWPDGLTALPCCLPVPRPATADSVRTMGYAAAVADSREQVHRLVHRNEALYADLVKRTDWAQKQERLNRERTQDLKKMMEQARQLSEELEERTRWAQSLDQSLQQVQARADHLQHYVEALHASTSWRLTRPLRFITRLGSNARANQAWNPLRWPVLLSNLSNNLRTLGLRGAIDRMQHIAPAADTPTPAPTTVPVSASNQPRANPDPVRLERTSHPRVSIIIPVYNKVAYTGACLQSIAEHTPADDWEVIVVDDCSTDQTQDYLARCQGIQVIRNAENSGFIHSCNAGAEAARGEFLVFLNNDTTVTEGWLNALLAPFDQIEDTGVVGGRLVYPDGSLQEAGGIIFNDASGWNYGRGDDPDRPQYNFVSEADYVSGACLAIRRDDFTQLGGFDTRFVPAYYEDTDLCFQIRALGKKVIYQPAAIIIHHEGISSGTEESSGTKRYQAINRDKFRKKWTEILSDHPAPEPDEGREDPVRHLRFRRSPKRVLLIDAVTPQPDHDSGSVRIMAMMTLLQEMGFQVSFMPENMAWVEGYSEAMQQAGIEVLCTPRIDSLEHWLAEHGQHLDLVIVSRYYVLTSLLAVIRRHCRRAKLIFDTVDLHFLREEREADLTGSSEAANRAAESRRQELALIRKSDLTLVVSAAEHELLAELVPGANVRIVSNIHRVHGCKRGWSDRKDLLFVGGFQHLPNVDAALWLVEDIFPRVRQRLPEARLHLIGSRMPPEIECIESPGVEVHGFVPELEPFLESCRLSVAPLRYGAGVKGKVNQAMSHGLPVVATQCAAEGMFLEHGRDVLIADEAAAFADCIVTAYEDESLWERLSQGGIKNVRQHFSMTAARNALAEAIKPEN